MKVQLNAAFRLQADEAIAPAEGFRSQNEEGLKDRQKDNQKDVQDKAPEPTSTEADTQTDDNEPEGGEGADGDAGGTEVEVDIPQDNDDDTGMLDDDVTATLMRLAAEEVEAEADPKLFNVANQPVGCMG